MTKISESATAQDPINDSRRFFPWHPHPLPRQETSGVVYRSWCSCGQNSYVEETGKFFRRGLAEHAAAVQRNGGSYQIAAHSTRSGHTFNFEEAESLARGDNRVRSEPLKPWFTDTQSINKCNDLLLPDSVLRVRLGEVINHAGSAQANSVTNARVGGSDGRTVITQTSNSRDKIAAINDASVGHQTVITPSAAVLDEGGEPLILIETGRAMNSMTVPANPPLARKRMVRPVEDFGGFGLHPPVEGAWDGCHTEDMTEEEYREWLDHTFRPLFEPYESQGGVPCRQLLTHFQYEDQGLPRERRIELVLKMDKNRDGRITFEEFRSTLVKIRYKDLPPVKRFGLRAVLAGNPGMRLAAAKVQAADHLRNIESLGRSGVFVQEVPDPVSGGFPNSKAAGGFYLEPDGVWPTSMQKGPPNAGQEQIALRKTITDEVYVPQSYLEAYNCRPPPIFIPLVVLAQIGVFIYYAVELNKRAVSEPLNQLTMISGFPYFSPLYFDPRRRREVWRFVSYFLVHQGIWHVLFNCIVTLIFGLLIEWVHKFWRVAPVYLAGVLAGSLISSVLDPFAILAGSSGGAYALIGSHLALIVMNWEELQHDVTTCRYGFLGFISSGVFRLCLILVFVGTDFGLALYRRYGLQADVSVSIAAHLGGFLAGLLVGIPVLRNLNEKPWERIVFWISMAILVALLVFAIFWNIFWTGYPTQLV